MNKKNYYLIAFTVLFLAFFALSVGNEKEIEESESNLNEKPEIESPREITDQDEITLETPEESWAGSMNNITIDELGLTVGSYTWAQANNEDWCDYKNGRYIIENATIDASTSPTGFGIFVNNSRNIYFTIRNCSITGATTAGIRLRRTCNGTIINNDCSNNNYAGSGIGISLESPSSPASGFSINNTIVNNTLNWNGYGIHTIYVSKNVIVNNTINNNRLNGIMLSSNSGLNNITNNRIRADSAVNPETEVGIRFYWGHDNNIINNTIINCELWGMYASTTSNGNTFENNTIINCMTGIGVYKSTSNNIINNTINNSRKSGISLAGEAKSTIIMDNTMINCSILLDPAQGNSLNDLKSNTIAANNTVNGKAVYYFVDEVGLGNSNFTNLGDIGQIILINCNDSDISDFTIPNPIPITLWYSNNNTIYHNTLDPGGYGFAGIFLSESSLNNITDNTINDHGDYGIYLISDCNNNTIDNNIANNNGYCGIHLYDNCKYNNITDNTVGNTGVGRNQDRGIWLYEYCAYNEIINNIVFNNSGVGIYARTGCYNITIKDNTVNKNDGSGIMLYDACHNITIRDNNVNDNEDEAILLQNNCDDNKIINNTASEIEIGQNRGIYLYTGCDNNLIENNTANDNYNYGIYLRANCHNNTIKNNNFDNNEDNSIRLYDNCDDNKIINNSACELVGGRAQNNGIFLSAGCDYNIIENNTANNNYDHGIYLLSNCHYNIIVNNTVYQNGLNGMFLSTNCDKNLIHDNTVNDNGVRASYNGIFLENGCDNNNITDNTVNDNYWIGIQIRQYSDGNLIANNTIESSHSTGIFLNYQCTLNDIIDNTIKGSLTRAIYCRNGADNNLILKNTITGSHTYRIRVDYDSDSNTLAGNTIIGSGTGILLTPDGGGAIDGTIIIGNTLTGFSTPISNGGSNTVDAMNKIDGICQDLIIDDDGGTADSFTWAEVLTYVPWFSGSGTPSDPYIIEDIEIDASVSSSGNGLLIIDSDGKDFIIRKCTIYDAVPAAGVAWDSNGNIRLENSNKGQIYSNDLTSTTGADEYKSGIYLAQCENITIINNTIDGSTYGIFMANSSKILIFNNSADSNNRVGIYLAQNCDYNNITQNSASHNNWYYGIALQYDSDNNNIINNTINDNGQGRNNAETYPPAGIKIYYGCDDNNIIGNYLTYNWDYGIYLELDCHNNTIRDNTDHDNGNDAIRLYNNCDDNKIIHNLASNTGASHGQDWGIYLLTGCDNNLIENNTANGNEQSGIQLYKNCHNNVIHNNTANGNYYSGIYLYDDCNDNNITNNVCNENYLYGIFLHTNCHNNTIDNNTVNDNISRGIFLHTNCDDNDIINNLVLNTISVSSVGIRSDWYCDRNSYINNTVNGHSYGGIALVYKCNDTIILNNTCNNNGWAGIIVYGSSTYPCKNNNITGNTLINNNIGISLQNVVFEGIINNNYIFNNSDGIRISNDADSFEIFNNDIINNTISGVNITTINCDDNMFYNNTFIGNADNAYDVGTNTKWNNTEIGNYWDDYGYDDDDDDGFGDDWYEVSVGVNDKLPIWWDAPVVSINFPNLNDIYGNDTIQYSITVDKGNINDPDFQMWYILDNGSIRKNATFTELIGYINYFIWNNFSNTFINITFYANDSRGFIGYLNVTIEKNLLIPTLSIIKIGFYGVGGVYTINFTVSLDGPGVDTFWYRIHNGTEWSENFSSSAVVGQLNKEIDLNYWEKYLGNGTWEIEFFLNDSKAVSLIETSKLTTLIKDIYAPQINITSPSNYEFFKDSPPPSITFDIDEGNLHQIWFNLNGGNNYTYLDVIEDDLDEIDDLIWENLANGTVIIQFWANDTGGNVNYTIVTLTVFKDNEDPIIIGITGISVEYPYRSTPPLYILEITETNFYQYWYTLFDQTNTYQSSPKQSGTNFFTVFPLSSGSSPRTASTTLSGSIDQSLWNQLNNGEITITFYVEDKAGNIVHEEKTALKDAQAAAVAVLPGEDDDDDNGADESVDWIIRALLAGVISGSVGISLRIAYSKIKKKREAAREAVAPTVVLKKKFQIVHHDFLRSYKKVEQKEFRVGIAQVGLSQKGNLITELFEMTAEGLMRIREDMVETVSANIKNMIDQAHENKVNILLFPEMTFDLNYKQMVKDVKKWAQDFNMYIITGGYHDIKTKQNICAVFGPEGIQWEQEKHTPATIHFGKHVFTEAIEVHRPPHKLHICSTEYGRIAIAICRDFLDMDLRVEIKNCEPPVDLFFNPAYTPVIVDFEATHFDARRSVYAYTFFANVAEYGGTIINTPEKDRTKRQIPPKEEGLIFKDVDLFSLRSERRKWERRQSKDKRYIQSTRS